MTTNPFEASSGFGIKARLLLAFGIMVTLTVAVGSVGWWGISNIQQALNILQKENLPEIAQSMRLAEQSASLVAQASFVTNAKILFHLDRESARLKEKLNAFSLLVKDLSARREGGNPNSISATHQGSSDFHLDSLAKRIETTLLELIDVTRRSIFLTARMRDQQYALNSAYEGLEGRITAQTHQSAEDTATSAEDNNKSAGGHDHNGLLSRDDRPLYRLSAILGEAHRIAGTLTAAGTAEDNEQLRTLQTRYQWGRLLLQQKLDQLTDTHFTKEITHLAHTLLKLGANDSGIFELRRQQFTNENRRTYLLTVSDILSAQLNDQVANIVGQVQQATETHSADAGQVLHISKARILFLGVICLVIAVISALYVIRDLGGNLSAVTHSMIRLAQGDRTTGVPAMARPDEIGSLARAFNVFKENMFKLDETSQQLIENNKLLAAIFDNMNDGLSVFDGHDRLVAWNPKFLELYGLPATDVGVGTPLDVINALLAKEGLTVRGLNGQPLLPEEFNRTRRRADQRVEEYLASGRILELRSNPMPDGGFVTVYTDLTERKAIEGQLRQAQKMESVGQLTGGLAHDFNNLLSAIIGNLSLLQEELVGQDQWRKKALRALEAAERGAAITQRLLAFSRKQALRPQQVNLNDLIEGMVDLLSYSLGETIHIKMRLQEDLWPIVIDPGQLENALMNLALNSRDAMPDGGQLLLQTENCGLDQAAAGKAPGIDPGDYVILSVQDTGLGMSEEVLNHVFEPFFTTKEVGAGSGLGLSMVYGFIHQSGGHISIDSALGKGTTLRFYLPRTEQGTIETSVRPRASETISFNPRDKLILVIEDDASVRQIATDMLTSLGYRTIQAGDGRQALKLLDETEDISLMLTDVILPDHLNGPDIVREARKKYPHIKVLYCSGYTRNVLIEDGHLNENVDLLNKPFKKESLAQKLHTLFERP
jgi:PAS domain S-box-containing protein